MSIVNRNGILSCTRCGEYVHVYHAVNYVCPTCVDEIAAEEAALPRCEQCHDNAPAKGFSLCGHCIGSNLHYGHDSLDEYPEFNGAQAEAARYLAAFRRELAGNLHDAAMRVAV